MVATSPFIHVVNTQEGELFTLTCLLPVRIHVISPRCGWGDSSRSHSSLGECVRALGSMVIPSPRNTNCCLSDIFTKRSKGIKGKVVADEAVEIRNTVS